MRGYSGCIVMWEKKGKAKISINSLVPPLQKSFVHIYCVHMYRHTEYIWKDP